MLVTLTISIDPTSASNNKVLFFFSFHLIIILFGLCRILSLIFLDKEYHIKTVIRK